MPTGIVKATQGGSTGAGMAIHVYVLTGAQPVAAQTGATGTFSQVTGTIFNVAGTIQQTTSIVLGAVTHDGATNVNTQHGGVTVVDDFSDATNGMRYCTFKWLTPSTGSQTLGTDAGSNAAGGVAWLELLAATTIAVDASSPALATTTSLTNVSTTSFTPPAGSLLVALVPSDGGAAQTTMSMSDTLGNLTWTEKVVSNVTQRDYVGVWLADVPGGAAATGLGQAQPGLSWKRHFRHPQLLLQPSPVTAPPAAYTPTGFRTAVRFPPLRTVRRPVPPPLPPLPGPPPAGSRTKLTPRPVARRRQPVEGWREIPVIPTPYVPTTPPKGLRRVLAGRRPPQPVPAALPAVPFAQSKRRAWLPRVRKVTPPPVPQQVAVVLNPPPPRPSRSLVRVLWTRRKPPDVGWREIPIIPTPYVPTVSKAVRRVFARRRPVPPLPPQAPAVVLNPPPPKPSRTLVRVLGLRRKPIEPGWREIPVIPTPFVADRPKIVRRLMGRRRVQPAPVLAPPVVVLNPPPLGVPKAVRRIVVGLRRRPRHAAAPIPAPPPAAAKPRHKYVPRHKRPRWSPMPPGLSAPPLPGTMTLRDIQGGSTAADSAAGRGTAADTGGGSTTGDSRTGSATISDQRTGTGGAGS